MKTIILILLAVSCVMLVPKAYAGSDYCGSAGELWPADRKGSMRLMFDDDVELIYRTEEGVIVARGRLRSDDGVRPFYAIYDLSNSSLVYARAKLTVKEQLAAGLPIGYPMQSHFDMELFGTPKEIHGEIMQLLERYQQRGCHDELIKKSQGRQYDEGKCEDVLQAWRKVMERLSDPEEARFKELTKNTQVRKYFDSLRAQRDTSLFDMFITDRRDPNGKKKAYCVSIETMDMKLIAALRKPETQKTMAKKANMPEYLDQGPGAFDRNSVDRYR